MENYAHHGHPNGSFDVRWRHFQPSLSISSPFSSVHDRQQFTQNPHAASVFPLYPGAGGGNQPYHSLSQQPSSSPTNPHVDTNSPPPSSQYNYLVRIINPEQKTKFITKVWHDVHEKFESTQQLKKQLIITFGEKLPPLSELECGYFEKRATGKRWIEDDKDLDAMYKSFNANDDITMWCEGTEQSCDDSGKKSGKKRKLDDGDTEESASTSKRTARETEIDKTTQELREIHGLDKWTLPQYRLWARMKVNGQHDDLDTPPQIPLFTNVVKTANKQRDSLKDALTSAATAVVGMIRGPQATPTPSTTTGTLSPSKRAQVSGQYLEHLEKLKKLHESGVLSLEEFNEQKGFALNNIRQLQ